MVRLTTDHTLNIAGSDSTPWMLAVYFHPTEIWTSADLLHYHPHYCLQPPPHHPELPPPLHHTISTSQSQHFRLVLVPLCSCSTGLVSIRDCQVEQCQATLSMQARQHLMITDCTLDTRQGPPDQRRDSSANIATESSPSPTMSWSTRGLTQMKDRSPAMCVAKHSEDKITWETTSTSTARTSPTSVETATKVSVSPGLWQFTRSFTVKTTVTSVPSVNCHLPRGQAARLTC